MRGIAGAFAGYALESGCRKMLIGRDNRSSSLQFRDIVVATMLEAGFDVYDLGLVVTPMFYFAARHLEIGAGVMITASHNSSEYNGCKLLLGESTIYGEEIQEIKNRVQAGLFPKAAAGALTFVDIADRYRQMIASKIKLGPNILKVVLDCGNGTASLFAPDLLRLLGCELETLYCDSDSRFPNHHPDPVNPENMQDLITRVKETKADIGIGIDGDGDRLGVVDQEGNMIWGDQLMILFWREILPRYPGTTCIVEVKCSQSLIDEIKKLGGQPMIYKTGHSLIKAKMKEINAVFTGEMSGHMFFADDYYGFDDALYASARLLQLLSHSEKNITEMLADVNKYYSTPEIRIKSSDDQKFKLVDQVLAHFKENYDVIDIDGARILFPHGWGLVRASNTGPEIICRCEGDSPEALKQIKNLLFTYLDSIGLVLPA